MRVVWMVYGELTQPTGGYVYDRLVVEGLRAQGHEVEILEPIGLASVPDGVDAVVGDALCARELGPLFDTARPAPRVLLVHHFPSWEVERADRSAMRALEARVVAASDRLIATGSLTRDRLAAEHPGIPIDCVLPGSDRLPRQPRETRSHQRIELLFVGSLVARKRLGLLFDAIEELVNPRIALTLVGDPTREPEHARELASRVEASPLLRGRVALTGVVGDRALAWSMARADALVLPSSLEGYGMVLTEALAAGLPVLASRSAAAAASLADHDAVLVFDEADGLTHSLRRFVNDPALRKAMSRAALETDLPVWRQTTAAFGEALRLTDRRP